MVQLAIFYQTGQLGNVRESSAVRCMALANFVLVERRFCRQGLAELVQTETVQNSAKNAIFWYF